nr:putative hydroxymethylpyrimidine/phosphomethylpyrimidine kinase 2 [Quercus suber]
MPMFRGLEADQKVIAAHGCYAMTATTALTAQNTQGVYGIHETPSTFVEQQIDACMDDIGVDVVKTATSGAQLLPEVAVRELCDALMPLTYLLTPNIPEANLILKHAGQEPIQVHDLSGLKMLAAAVQKLGPKYVLLKGGHLALTSTLTVAREDSDRKWIANVIHGGDSSEVVQLPYQHSRNTHGTGCSLAYIVEAVRAACYYVDAGIRTSPGFGSGSGPLNHFHSIQTLPFAPKDVQPAWHDFTQHEFVARMGDGTLPPDAFKFYMIQDYLYLIHFARANALAGYKSKKLDDIVGAAQIVTHIRSEIDLHLNECKEFGLSQDDIEQHEESQACTAYTRYVLDIGMSEDWLALQIALLPCLLGYAVIAKNLHELQQKIPPKLAPNRYLTWINNYIAEDYATAVEKGSGESATFLPTERHRC